MFKMQHTLIEEGFIRSAPFQHFTADSFPTIQPIHWLTSHFAVGGWSPLNRLSGMLTAHMTQIAPRNGFTWHPHRGLEIYTWVLEGTLYHEDTTGGKGEIRAGELQRMFSGDWIEHQELNLSDKPARVIQIWFVADRQYRDLSPHYQQAGNSDLPAHRAESSTTWDLIGGGSPMEQHINGRLTATTVDVGGTAVIAPPPPGEDLFLYITDGAGQAIYEAESPYKLGQYDVMLATSEAETATVQAGDAPLHYLSFYLPQFLS